MSLSLIDSAEVNIIIPSITAKLRTKRIDVLDLFIDIKRNSSKILLGKQRSQGEETYTRTVNPDLSIQPKTNAVLAWVEQDIKQSR